MAKNDELPPIGLPLTKPGSSSYFFRITAVVFSCAALVFGVGYGWLRLASGPCDELRGEALAGLEAEVDFFRDSGTALGLSSVEIHELRVSAQAAGESLAACCEQQREGRAGEGDLQECRQHAAAIAALPAQLAAAHNDATTATETVRTTAEQLRRIATDLTEIASRGAQATPASVAAGPPSDARSED